MIEADSPKNLYEKLELANRQMKNAKNREEKMAISNYICYLYDSIRLVSSDATIPSDKNIYGTTKNIPVFNKKLDEYENKVMKNFLINKKFHNRFFESIFKRIDHERRILEEDEYSGITDLKEDEFYTIFFEFMTKIGLNKYFDKFVKDNRIYKTKIQYNESTLGYTLYNPLTKDSDIFIEDMEYDIYSMFTLAHEFGHVYDLNNFDEGVENYNKYAYQSFNKEVTSKTFERLFLDFLIEKNILVNEAKDELFDMTNFNYEFILTAYLLTLIPDIYLIDNSYLDLSRTKIYKLVERYFNKKNNIRRFINKSYDLEVNEAYNYAYGDIYSMFFKEMIKDNDYKLDVLDEFFKYRSELFSPEQLDKFKITPKRYVKLYKKDIEMLKK